MCDYGAQRDASDDNAQQDASGDSTHQDTNRASSEMKPGVRVLVQRGHDRHAAYEFNVWNYIDTISPGSARK